MESGNVHCLDFHPVTAEDGTEIRNETEGRGTGERRSSEDGCCESAPLLQAAGLSEPIAPPSVAASSRRSLAPREPRWVLSVGRRQGRLVPLLDRRRRGA